MTKNGNRWPAGFAQLIMHQSKVDIYVNDKTELDSGYSKRMSSVRKTILTAIVVDYLREKHGSNEAIGLAYVFCNFHQQQSQKLDSVLANILGQLIRGLYHISEEIRDFYKNYQRTQMRPRLNDIVKMLGTVSGLYSHVYVVIDALDECSNSDRMRDHLISHILDLQRDFNISFMATARFIPEITVKFERFPSLEIQASDADIRRYAEGNLPSSVRRRPQVQKLIVSEIVRKVDGMFLLARLYLDSLKGKCTTRDIKNALSNFKTGSDAYDHAYEKAMEQVEQQIADRAQLAKRLLAWLTCAERALTLTELQHALAVVISESSFDEENLPDVEDMISSCAGLVTYNEENHIIRLVHYTTQEYLHKTWAFWFPNAHREIGEACVTYLAYDDFEDGICKSEYHYDERLRKYPLYQYAATNWGRHAGKQPPKLPLTLNLLNSNQKLAACWQAWTTYHYEFIDDMSEQRMGLHVAAEFGLEREAGALLRLGHLVDEVDSLGSTPLLKAVRNGHERVVRLLIENGASPLYKDDEGDTVLSVAAEGGHQSLVKILIDVGVDVNFGDKYGPSAPPCAAATTHEGVVRLPLDAAADVNDPGLTPLSRAAANGLRTVDQLWIYTGPEINNRKRPGQSPLRRSAEKGHREVVEMLLNQGAEPDLLDRSGSTPLMEASSNGHTDVVSLLLGAGAQPNLFFRRSTALGYAVRHSQKAVVQLLLAHGADPNVPPDAPGRNSPLSDAIRGGDVDIVETLLQHGAKPCSETLSAFSHHKRDKIIFEVLLKHGLLHELAGFQNPLILWAVKHRFHLLVEILVEQNVDINLRDSQDGDTPLLVAMANGDHEITKLLIEKGADLEVQDKHGRTPLLKAAEQGEEALVQLLLDKAANIRSEDDMGQTALFCALRNGHKAICLLLLGQDPALFNVRDKFGRSPLLLAAEMGLDTLMELQPSEMISNRELTDIICSEIAITRQSICLCGGSISADEGTALMAWAVANDHLAVVEALLEANINCERGDDQGRSPFIQAIAHGHLAIVKTFLERHHDLNEQDRIGGSALSWAFYRVDEAIIQLLLEKGADPNAYTEPTPPIPCMYRSYSQMPPLLSAANMGLERVVKLLLQNGASPGITIVEEANVMHSDGKQSTPKYYKSSALSLAVSGRHYKIVEMLLAHGADNDQCHTSLEEAMRVGYRELAFILTKRIGTNWLIDEHGQSLIFRAAYHGHVGIVQGLLDSGIEPDTRSTSHLIFLGGGVKANRDTTPLLIAAQRGHDRIVQLLLERGADPNVNSPLRHALDRGHGSVVEMLLLHGADLDINKDGVSLLLKAAQKGLADVVKILLKSGALPATWPEPETCYQKHPLFEAVSRHHTDVVKAFLDGGQKQDRVQWYSY
ncbi:uncharacterized protein CDV56_101206 [Aspergillus thermomutatus]|uniref:Uncharacterized protein n=1 Tax=Aspergillus thermomutatus TaxID=41047 RepID=A0A397G7B2_ASPTH|nr:uncharacterized protein CDV56_101206 [Aspergillus thermomutatus]RHZ45744.1 hypothetical protein CDV56_101206 [Aspergillus thermomutatus]